MTVQYKPNLFHNDVKAHIGDLDLDSPIDVHRLWRDYFSSVRKTPTQALDKHYAHLKQAFSRAVGELLTHDTTQNLTPEENYRLKVLQSATMYIIPVYAMFFT